MKQTKPAAKVTVKKVSPKKTSAKRPAAPRGAAKADVECWRLRLYIAGPSPRSVAALSNLRKLCDLHLEGRCRFEIEVIDLIKHPQLAKGDQIFAVPTLVRKLPEPMKRIIGDLSNMERSLVGLDLCKR